MNFKMNDNDKSEDLIKKTKKLKSEDKFLVTWVISIVAVCFLISTGLVLALYCTGVPGLASIGNITKQKFYNIINDVKTVPSLPFNIGRQNILFMGLDSNGRNTDPFKGTRSDSMIVVSIDPATKSANVLSIPRDSKVYLSDNHGLDKINAAHAYGGPDLTIRTIQDTFGIKIDHYIALDFRAVRELVKAFGGVSVNVEKRMVYRDRTAGLNIDLHPGYQVLTPEQAEGYLRFRHYAVGDIGRMQRQQWFMRHHKKIAIT